MSENNIQKPSNRSNNSLKTIIPKPLKAFINDSRAVGIVLIACTAISLFLSNMDFSQEYYTGFWEITTHTGSFLHLPENFLLWVNDALMAVFFLTVGIEIKRELMVGELASIQKSMLPIIAALGGMIVPAFIYFIFNNGTPFHHGWGIPMATDIAFSLGILSLLGKKAPVQLKVFLAALAIIDDLGAILVIAIFYSSGLSFVYLLSGLGGVVILAILNKMKVKQMFPYLLIGVLIWYCILNSGVHATIAGVLLAFCIPVDIGKRLEGKLTHFVDFIIMPLFALANTAIIFPNQVGHIVSSPITIGVFLGLLLGKPIGIVLFSFLSTKLKIAALPDNTSWKQMTGVGMIAGIGFTMSIFISVLAFSNIEAQDIAKIAV
ncbi:MAG TPA: Na+/H+ antiporter NhaA, partial [Chitinophagaceae bacterium]|nr:Na+/H+ antiporter NhaA [Chitinophagaceae bacterium]